MALAYFWIAQQLDEQKERFSLTEGEQQTVAEAIITAAINPLSCVCSVQTSLSFTPVIGSSPILEIWEGRS